MKIVTFSSWKGGTGKTTLTSSTIKNLSENGKKILVIDLDSNISITTVFNMAFKNITSINLLNGETVEPYEVSKNIDIIPSDMRISKMANLHDGVLKRALKKMDLEKYDYVFIDPPGTMNSLTRNAMKAADTVIIPAMPSEIDLHATGYVLNEMEEMELESDVNIVLNGNDPKKNLDDIYKKFAEQYDGFFYPYPISAMKSLKNLTHDILNYKLIGKAKTMIDSFVEGVVL